jgi:hypothetical protein
MGGPTGTGSVIVGSTKKGRAGRPDVWHRHNAIFVLNPSKVRHVTCYVLFVDSCSCTCFWQVAIVAAGILSAVIEACLMGCCEFSS